DRDVLLERGADLDADPVVLLRDALAARVVIARPARPNDNEQRVTAFQRVLQVAAEVDPNRDRVVVHEHGVALAPRRTVLALVVFFQAIEDTAGDPAGVLAPIRNCDPRHTQSPRSAHRTEGGWEKGRHRGAAQTA